MIEFHSFKKKQKRKRKRKKKKFLIISLLTWILYEFRWISMISEVGVTKNDDFRQKLQSSMVKYNCANFEHLILNIFFFLKPNNTDTCM